MLRHLLALTAVLGALTAAWGGHGVGDSACSPAHTVWAARDSTELAVLAVGTGEWDSVVRTWSRATDTAVAQSFRVAESAPRDVGFDTFRVIPLVHGPQCEIAPRADRSFVPVGDTVVFLLRERANRAESGELPLFEQWTFHGPYPTAGQMRRVRSRGDRILSPTEFMHYLGTLPDGQLTYERPDSGLALFLQDVAPLTDTLVYPVSDALDFLRQVVRKSGSPSNKRLLLTPKTR